MSGKARDDKPKSPRGSPSATETIDGKYLPPPSPFGGEINMSAEESTERSLG